MIPIFDSLGEHIKLSEIETLIQENRIITLPLAFMRGTTFKDSFVLLDEAQNTTPKQMHLFLTRIGRGSKMVITGDPSQSDLARDNGFTDAIDLLCKEPINGLAFVELDPNSVVRHSIIPDINKRYEQKLGRKDAPPSSI